MRDADQLTAQKTSISRIKTHPEQTEVSAATSCSQEAWMWLSGENHTLTPTQASLNENYEWEEV